MVLKRIRNLLARRAAKAAAETAPQNERVDSPVPAAPPAVVHRGPEIVHQPVALTDLDPDAVRIIKRLTRFDHAAYLVGGCVRDLLLARKPKDFDIGTSATPRQIKRLFSNCRIIGRRFRLAHIYFQGGKIIEVATFRARDVADNGADPASAVEGDDDILIRDDNVFGTPEEDALRRDFTINALFYDVNGETVIDHADGLADLRRRLVRTIGDPQVRFREDPIRILRAVKFAARLDFSIEPKTLAALRATRTEIPKAAPPRILEEINRFCRSGAARRSIELCFETEVFEILLPELAGTYSSPGPEREALAALMEAIDARWTAGHDVSTGEIFAALLFAAAAPALGLMPGGAPAPRDGRDARTIVDDIQRPIAVRLRLARKDQERTRQALATLQRMVPLKPMRRGTRLALTRRPAFVDALWMLEALAPVLGHVAAAALPVWAETAAAPASPAGARPQVAAPDAAAEPAEDGQAVHAEEERRPGRRRGRRGGRRHRKGREEGRVETGKVPPPVERPVERTAERPAARAASSLPPVWDDNYFFAALPSVPALDADDAETDRYGARMVVSHAAPAPTPTGPPTGPTARKRSRRGGRRHRKNRPGAPTGGSTPDTEGDES